MLSFAKLAVVALVIYVCFSLMRRLRPKADSAQNERVSKRAPQPETLEKCPKCGVYYAAGKGVSCPNCDDTTRQKS